MYTCTADNQEGVVRAHVHVTIAGRSDGGDGGGVIVGRRESVEVVTYRGSQVEMKCLSGGPPSLLERSIMIWSHDGHVVHESARVRYDSWNGSLVLSPLHMEDTGLYKCRWWDNGRGETNFTLEVKVRRGTESCDT